jgi:BON domain
MAQRDSYGRGGAPDFRQGYLRGDLGDDRTIDRPEGYRSFDANEPMDRYGPGGPHVSRRGGPGAYGPFNDSIYAGGGGAYPMTPGYMDWGGHTGGAGDRTIPGHDGDDFPGENTWGEYEYRQEARTAGPHAGRGPKNWRRADERICEDINEALTRHPDIDATGIEVKVAEGEVTLGGEVDDRHMKRLAEDVAERCSGVRDVHNRLRVSPRGEQ